MLIITRFKVSKRIKCVARGTTVPAICRAYIVECRRGFDPSYQRRYTPIAKRIVWTSPSSMHPKRFMPETLWVRCNRWHSPLIIPQNAYFNSKKRLQEMMSAGKAWRSERDSDHFVRLAGQHVRTLCTHSLYHTGITQSWLYSRKWNNCVNIVLLLSKHHTGMDILFCIL